MSEPGVRVQILYFASARERAGVNRESVALSPGATVAQLRARLSELHPGLEALLPRLRFAVNQKLAEDGAMLEEGDEVALIPPVAGGAGDFAVTSSPLELRAVVAAVEGPAVGGIATFTGNVRDHSEGKRVVKLEYEAYEPMAVASFRQIAAEIDERWPGTRVAIHHRTGTLEIGEAAVVIAAAAAHRKEAFAACEYAIDRIKDLTPIWKKEFFEDGAVWIDPHAPKA